MINDVYFQFPLCTLSFGENEHVRLEAIICFGVFKGGERMLAHRPDKTLLEFLDQTGKAKKFPVGFVLDEIRHGEGLYAADVMGIQIKDFPRAFMLYQRLDEYIFRCEQRHGRDTLVRIKAHWAFKARDGQGLTYRDFWVLCAIYSILGKKKFSRITLDRIRCRALGYRSAAIMEEELPDRADQAKPLTRPMLKNTIAKLHRQGFFARCTACRLYTYYSIRLDNEALRKMVLERHTYAA